MRSFLKIALPVVLILALIPGPAFALQTEPPPALDVATLAQLALAAFTALVGWPALLSVVITGLRFKGWVTAETAEKINLYANILVFGGIFALAVLGKIDLINTIDASLGNAAQLVTYLLILLGVPLGFGRTQNEQAALANSKLIGARIR